MAEYQMRLVNRREIASAGHPIDLVADPEVGPGHSAGGLYVREFAIDSLRSLGIVWIPGLMARMLLSGTRPAYAAIYQFVVLAMIFASSGLTSLMSTLLMRTHVLSPAEQLVLRAEN